MHRISFSCLLAVSEKPVTESKEMTEDKILFAQNSKEIFTRKTRSATKNQQSQNAQANYRSSLSPENYGGNDLLKKSFLKNQINYSFFLQ